MNSFVLYNVSTPKGGSLDTIVVDARYDTPEERQHRAWCKMFEDKRSPHHRMLMRLVDQMGVDKVKAQFCAALCFEKVG